MTFLLFFVVVKKKAVIIGDERNKQSNESQRLQFSAAELRQQLISLSVEQITSFLRVESGMSVAPSEFQAMLAYRRGMYEKCLQLSLEIINNSVDETVEISYFIVGCMTHLVDDNMASILAVCILCMPSFSTVGATISQLFISLYLSVKCKLKLKYSLNSLIHELHLLKKYYTNCRTTGIRRAF
jgi:hypothetical protein